MKRDFFGKKWHTKIKRAWIPGTDFLLQRISGRKLLLMNFDQTFKFFLIAIVVSLPRPLNLQCNLLNYKMLTFL